MISIKKYARVAFHVGAVQVTEDNMGDVADWCGGDIRTMNDEEGDLIPYIKVRVKRPLTPRQTKAFIGDWVLQAGTGYKVYTDNAFQKCFEPAEPKKLELAAHKTELDLDAETEALLNALFTEPIE